MSHHDGLLRVAGGLQLLLEVQRLVAVGALVAELVITPPNQEALGYQPSHWGARSQERLKDKFRLLFFTPMSAAFVTSSTGIRTYSERIHFSPEYATEYATEYAYLLAYPRVFRT